MSPQITRKSTTGSEMVDSSGSRQRPGLAVRLGSCARAPLIPATGAAPQPMPEAPVGLEDLGPAAGLTVTGAERESWLQGMQTADLLQAPLGGAVAGCFLGARGRLVAAGLLWRSEGAVRITVEPERAEPLSAHLDKLLIMEDAALAPLSGLRRLRYWPGVEVPAGLPAPLAALTGPLLPLGLELLVPEAQAQELLAALPARPDPAACELTRVALGVASWGRELLEDTVPLEAGLRWQVSYEKGCYVGQEVIAMATYRGQVAWCLSRLRIDGPPPAPNLPLDAEKGKKGRIASAVPLPGVAGSLALGYVHREHAAPGTRVALGDGRQAEVLGPPIEWEP